MPLIPEFSQDGLPSTKPVVMQLGDDLFLGVKKIVGTELSMLEEFPHLHLTIAGIRNKERMLERMSVYQLLYNMLDDTSLIIQHNEDGKPLLTGWQISVSDTKGYVAIILSKTKNVAIDIEYMSTRVEKIAGRFIRKDEQSASVNEKLLNWSAKETVFKYYSNQHLGYFDMRLLPYNIDNQECVIVENTRSKSLLKVDFCFTDEFVLTCAWDRGESYHQI